VSPDPSARRERLRSRPSLHVRCNRSRPSPQQSPAVTARHARSARDWERVADGTRRCRLGRQPTVSAPTPDCCIDPAVCKLMDLKARAPRDAVLLGEAKQQRHAHTARCLLRPASPGLEQARSPRGGSSKQQRSDGTAHSRSRPQAPVRRRSADAAARAAKEQSRRRIDQPLRPQARFVASSAQTRSLSIHRNSPFSPAERFRLHP
jgi:hypothetical protein